MPDNEHARSGSKDSDVHTAKRDWLDRILSIVGWILIVPAIFLFICAFLVFLSGDGFTDAAPWWVVIAMLGGALAVPGLVFLGLSRLRSKIERSASEDQETSR